jgi:hypothetical protein
MAAARLALLALLAVFAAPLAGHAAAQTRSVVPIHARTLSDGVVRYSVPLTLGGQMVEAALDTGSTGLRWLASGRGGRRVRYAYSGGVQLDGTRAAEPIAIGGLSGEADVHRVSKIGCTRARPDCSAKAQDIDAFGFEGDGLPGQGFRAILGTSLASGAKDNPLRRLGARRWIVSLPRGAAEGQLVLNPTDEDLTGFVLLPLERSLAWRKDGAHDGIEGCLQAPAGGRRLCGPVLLDTGAAGAAVVNGGGGAAAWVAGASLSFNGVQPVELHRPLSAGRGDDMPRPMILAGAAPYLAFDVLYDPERGVIGLRPRR